jgi:hypothetical protein
MIWLLLAAISVLLSLAGTIAERRSLELLGRISLPVALLLWLWQVGQLPSLGGDEERLLLWFGWGLGAALLAEVLKAVPSIPASVPSALLPASALLYALGLDFLRPDTYALIPASILGMLVGALAVRIGARIWPRLSGGVAALKLLGILPYALLVYGAFYKLFDRNWLLPWSYLIAAGAVLLALAQLWAAWNDHFERGIKPAWILLVYQLAQLLIVVAALYHYRQYY